MTGMLIAAAISCRTRTLSAARRCVRVRPHAQQRGEVGAGARACALGSGFRRRPVVVLWQGG